jgi:acyl-CoA hydrolase
MSQRLESSAPDLGGIVRPGDHIVWSQAAGEPLTLIEALLAQRHALGPLSVFMAATFTDLVRPEHADRITFTGFGAIGNARRLTKTGVLGVVPCHVGQIARYIEDGQIGCDVAFVHVAPAGPDGRHSYGVINDFIQSAVSRARVVVAEINERMPATRCDATLAPQDIDYFIETSRPLVQVVPAPIGETERAIAGHAASYIADGSVLQVGIGAVPDALLQLVSDRRDLGVHSGMIGDGLVDLVRSGVITNARKNVNRGVSVTGALIGSQRLYDFAADNGSLLLCRSSYTHGEAVLAGIENLVSINTAVEVDLGGQVNAEQVGDDYMGGVGGQVDYVRAGHRSRGGRSIIALPATAKGGALSRIRASLSGPVTTARSEVDTVITEFGAAELRGLPLPQRARRLIAIAHPAHRGELESAAQAIFKRGY